MNLVESVSFKKHKRIIDKYPMSYMYTMNSKR